MPTHAEIEAEVKGLWESVREASRYGAVLAWAQQWLRAMWPYAHRLGYAPKGKGYDEYLLTNCPRIKESNTLGEHIAGRWSGGDFIWVATQPMMKQFGNASERRVRDELRATILHETQHAFDSLRGVEVRGCGGHNIWFARRLRKLEDAFPPEGD